MTRWKESLPLVRVCLFPLTSASRRDQNNLVYALLPEQPIAHDACREISAIPWQISQHIARSTVRS